MTEPVRSFDALQHDAGYLLRAVRQRLKVSQRELAVLAGIGQSTVARMEAQVALGNWETLRRILTAAGCEVRVFAGSAALEPPRYDEAIDRAGRRLPAHAEARRTTLLDTWLDAHRRPFDRPPRRWTFDHPKPHSRWERWSDWRTRPPAPLTVVNPAGLVRSEEGSR